MDLYDLPQFSIAEVHGEPEEGRLRLLGHLSHVRGVRNTRGSLYVSGTTSVFGELDQLPTAGAAITFHALSWNTLPALAPGVTLPWLDGYWEPYQIAMVLDRHHQWKRRTFVAEPAQHFDHGGLHGWQKAGQPLPVGARALGIEPGGWDHEHCDLCNAHIGTPEQPAGYVDPDNTWLCERCHDQYAAVHDIAFVADA